MKKAFVILPLIFVLSSCAFGKHEELKSPCVGAENSPCDRRAPVNNHV